MRRSTLECFFIFLFLPLIIRLASGCRTRGADVGPEGRRLHKSGLEKDDPASLLLLHLHHSLRPPRPLEGGTGPPKSHARSFQWSCSTLHMHPRSLFFFFSFRVALALCDPIEQGCQTQVHGGAKMSNFKKLRVNIDIYENFPPQILQWTFLRGPKRAWLTCQNTSKSFWYL